MNTNIKNFLLGLIDSNTLESSMNIKEEEPISQKRKEGNRWLILHDGMEKTLKEWAEYTGINRHTLYSRLRRGWDIEKVLYTPVKPKSNYKELTSTFFEVLAVA